MLLFLRPFVRLITFSRLMKYRFFLLSPARVTGKRAQMLFSSSASFDLARRIRGSGAPLGEVFSFMSGLYFRGKLDYANRFARPYRRLPGVFVITSNRGLIPAATVVRPEDLLSFGEVPIDLRDARYLQALTRSAIKLSDKFPQNSEIVLLGSISTKKYAELLERIFGSRLKFPAEFIGRGDMSRGGLLLRSVAANRELEYIPVAGAVRHGKRPPKLPPRKC